MGILRSAFAVLRHPHRRAARVLALLGALLFATGAAAESYIARVEWFADPDSRLSVEEIAAAPFAPAHLPFAAGFGEGSWWFRLRLRAPAPGQAIHLRVGPNWLDEIVLFDPDPQRPGQWRERSVGDRQPFSARESPTIVPTFALERVDPEATYYLRVRSTSTILVMLEAIGAREAPLRDVRLHAITIGLALVMLMMLAWAVGAWVDDQQPVLLAFIGVQLVYSVQVIAIGGFLPPLAPAGWPGFADATMNLVTVLASFSLLVLNRALLRPCGLPVWGRLILDGLLLLLPVALLCVLAGRPRIALEMASWAMFVIVFLSPVLVLLARRDPLPGRRILFTVLCLQGLVMVGSRLVVIGVASGPFETLTGMRVLGFGQGLVSSGLLAIFLLLRQREVHRRAREAEQAVREHARRIESMHVELEKRAVEAEAGNRAKTAFLAIMGHEFRTPLNAIVGFAETLLSSLGQSSQRELVGRQVAAARNLQGMIDDVLDLARASAAEDSDGAVFAPARLLGELRDRARERSRSRGIALALEVDPEVPAWVHGDLARISRALWHYVDNALKYTREGSITLAVRRQGVSGDTVGLRFEVRDTGAGIAPALRERLFVTLSPQEEYLSREAGGAGIGLALVRQLAGVLGGSAGCESEPGRGSTFWLDLPLERASAPAALPAAEAETPLAPALATPGAGAMADLRSAIAELCDLLAADDIRATRRFAELEAGLAASMPAEQFARLHAQVEGFDFVAAHHTLQAVAAGA